MNKHNWKTCKCAICKTKRGEQTPWNKGIKKDEYTKHYPDGFGGHKNKGLFHSKYPLTYDKNWLLEQHYGFDLTIKEMAEKLGCKKQHIYNRMYELNIPIIDDIRSSQRNENGEKKCFTCKEWLDKNQFTRKKTTDGLEGICKKCRQVVHLNETMNVRIIAIQVYTDGKMKCELCGEDDIDVLSFDHIHGNGNAHRKSINNQNFNRWLIKNNFPEGYRVLCRNCNWKAQLTDYSL